MTRAMNPRRDGAKCRKLRAHHLIGPTVAVLLAALFNARVATYAGKPTGDGVPAEAIPIYAHPDMSVGNKIFEYLFPLIAPVGTLIDCPIHEPDAECMARARDSVRAHGDFAWKAILNEGYKESAVMVERGEGEPPLRVLLLRSANGNGPPNPDPPLILWMHGGGFSVGTARDGYIRHLLKGLKEASANHPALRDAVWASVDYRLAPEHPYPAALVDCYLALQHLLRNHTLPGIETRLGAGGIHLAGVSAGATLAAQTALWALREGLRVDSMYLDEPAFPVVSCSMKDVLDGRCNPYDSQSYRRNAFTRIPPFRWVDWVLHAYTGCPPAKEYLGKGVRERLCDKEVDFVNGTLSVEEWRAVAKAHDDELPPVVILTAKADILHDLVHPFIDAYTEAAGGEDRVRLHHIDAAASHSMPYLFDPDAGKIVVDTWGGIINSVATRD